MASDQYGVTCQEALYAFGTAATLSLLPLLKHHDPIFRGNTANFIGSIRDERATPALLPLLKDRDDDVRRSAQEALAAIKTARITAMGGSPANAPQLNALVMNGTERIDHRLAALQALEAQRYPHLGDLVVTLLRNPQSPFCRQSLRAAADLTIDSRVPPLLISALKTPEAPFSETNFLNEDVRSQAYRALIAWSDPANLKAIIASGYQLESTEADATSTPWHDPLFDFGVPITDALLALSTSHQPQIRARVAALLAQIDDPRAKDALAAMHIVKPVQSTDLPTDSDSAPPSFPLERWAQGDFQQLDEVVSYCCIMCISVVGSTQDLPFTAQLATLPQTARIQLADRLIALLTDEDGGTRNGAVILLSCLREPRTVAPLLAAFTEEDDDLTISSVLIGFALARIKDPSAIASLLVLLNDAELDLVAADTLAEIDGLHTMPAIIAHVQEYQQTFPTRAIQLTYLLARFNDPRTADLMLWALDAYIDESRMNRINVHSEVIACLATLKERRAIDPLIAMLRDTDDYGVPRAQAAAALRQITGQQFGAHYARWKAWRQAHRE